MRQCNNEELIQLEAKRHQITLQVTDLQAQLKSMQDDKVTLLGYLEERETAFQEERR